LILTASLRLFHGTNRLSWFFVNARLITFRHHQNNAIVRIDQIVKSSGRSFDLRDAVVWRRPETLASNPC